MTTGGTAPAPARLLIVLSLTVVYAFCYAAIKAGLSSAPPLLFAGLRAMIAGAALLALAAVVRRPLLPRSAGLGCSACRSPRPPAPSPQCFSARGAPAPAERHRQRLPLTDHPIG